MPKLGTAILAGVATLLSAGTAVAAPPEPNTMTVDLPAGSVAHVSYYGDVRPQVTLAMRPQQRPVAYDDDNSDRGREFDRDPVVRERQRQEALSRAAVGEPPALTGGLPLVVPGPAPRGATRFYTLISPSSHGGACVQTVEWRSMGLRKEPEVTRTDTGDCGP